MKGSGRTAASPIRRSDFRNHREDSNVRIAFRAAALLTLVTAAAGCRSDGDENLRDAYERMMASAQRTAAEETVSVPADTGAAPADAPTGPGALPIDTLPSAAAPPPPAPVAPAPPAETPPEPAPPAAQPEPQQRAGAAGSTLRGVRTAGHEQFDRIVFEFDGAVPGHRLDYIDRPIRECGSGRVLQVAGQAWLRVRFDQARAHELVDGFAQATVASRNRTLDHALVQQLVLTCDAGGQLEWVAGVRTPNQFRLLQLTEPARLVVDINH
jgi:hypothetical protein